MRMRHILAMNCENSCSTTYAVKPGPHHRRCRTWISAQMLQPRRSPSSSSGIVNGCYRRLYNSMDSSSTSPKAPTATWMILEFKQAPSELLVRLLCPFMARELLSMRLYKLSVCLTAIPDSHDMMEPFSHFYGDFYEDWKADASSARN
jgi:hypothetical protein